MKIKKNAGIWLDHSTANLIDLNSNKNSISISSSFTFDTKEEALNKSEKLMHNKRQQLNEAFYKEVAEKVLKYDHVLLFGPTNAKTELHNYLNKDMHFNSVEIDVETADNITDNEKVAFVKSHFKM